MSGGEGTSGDGPGFAGVGEVPPPQGALGAVTVCILARAATSSLASARPYTRRSHTSTDSGVSAGRSARPAPPTRRTASPGAPTLRGTCSSSPHESLPTNDGPRWGPAACLSHEIAAPPPSSRRSKRRSKHSECSNQVSHAPTLAVRGVADGEDARRQVGERDGAIPVADGQRAFAPVRAEAPLRIDDVGVGAVAAQVPGHGAGALVEGLVGPVPSDRIVRRWVRASRL